MAFAKLAPLRKSALATATAAYEQEEEVAPKPQARAKPLRSGRPRVEATARFETTVWTTAESKKPSASGQSTSQNMKNEICNAWRTGTSTAMVARNRTKAG